MNFFRACAILCVAVVSACAPTSGAFFKEPDLRVSALIGFGIPKLPDL